MASEAGSEGQRPGFIIAQPIGLGVGKNKIMRAEGPIYQAMSRAFSPCDFYFQITQPDGLGYYETGPLALRTGFACHQIKSHPSKPASLATISIIAAACLFSGFHSEIQVVRTFSKSHAHQASRPVVSSAETSRIFWRGFTFKRFARSSFMSERRCGRRSVLFIRHSSAV